MFENEQPNSEINLNLKMPPDQPDGDFSMKNLILTIYNARKVFLTWCCIGLLLGIIAAGGYYLSNRGAAPAAVPVDVSVTLTLNYAGAESALFPNGAPFDARLFYEDTGVWANALNASGNDAYAIGDVMSRVQIKKAVNDENVTENVYIITIPSGSDIFGGVEGKKSFLHALCIEYQNYITGRYYTESGVGTLYGQYLKTWDDACADITFDEFAFDRSMSALSSRYQVLAGILVNLYNGNPTYRSSEGKSFDDYSKDIKNIYIKDISLWSDKLTHNIYIRNIDRFISEARLHIDTMERNRRYNLELVGLYNELLASFQQKDGQGVVINEAVALLGAAQSCAASAADLQRQIDQTEYYLDALKTNGQIIRGNSGEAEAALDGFISGLSANQDRLRSVIYEYYKQENERAADSAVIYSSVSVVTGEEQAPAGGVSMTRILMLLLGLTFVGFIIGFCSAFIKKYIAEAKQV